VSFDDREAIVATVEETYALMGRAISVERFPFDLGLTVNPEVVERIMAIPLDPYVSDEEMLALLREAYFDLVENVIRIHQELLGEEGARYDDALEAVALTGSGRAVKVHGFRRAIGKVLGRVPGVRFVKKAFQWGNIILGSLGGVPVVGVLADPIRELKESIEAQGDDDQAL
jgi:hypothetical protein